MLFLWKEIEQWGTGTNEIVDMCVDHGLPEPEFEETNASFVVTVRKRLTEEFLMEKGLNERQIEAVKFVREKNSIKNKEYRELFDVSKRTATSDLSELAEKGILKKRGKGRQQRYVLP